MCVLTEACCWKLVSLSFFAWAVVSSTSLYILVLHFGAPMCIFEQSSSNISLHMLEQRYKFDTTIPLPSISSKIFNFCFCMSLPQFADPNNLGKQLGLWVSKSCTHSHMLQIQALHAFYAFSQHSTGANLLHWAAKDWSQQRIPAVHSAASLLELDSCLPKGRGSHDKIENI